MHLVMIGGSDAGISAALRAREVAPAAEVTVVLEDAYPNFSICGIPYYLSGEVTHWRDLAHRSLTDLEAAGIRLRLDTTARRIDVPARKLLITSAGGGEEVLGYDKLVVGTGAVPADDLCARAGLQPFPQRGRLAVRQQVDHVPGAAHPARGDQWDERAPAHRGGEMPVGPGDPYAGVDHEQDRVAVGERGLGLRAHATRERCRVALLQPGGVDDGEFQIAECRLAFAPVARDAGGIVDQRKLAPD